MKKTLNPNPNPNSSGSHGFSMIAMVAFNLQMSAILRALSSALGRSHFLHGQLMISDSTVKISKARLPSPRLQFLGFQSLLRRCCIPHSPYSRENILTRRKNKIRIVSSFPSRKILPLRPEMSLPPVDTIILGQIHFAP